MQAKMTNRITRIFVLLLGLLPVQYAQAQAPDLAIPARKKSRLTANGAVLAAFALLALTLIPAHHASAQIFDSTNPTLTYSITEDASPNTVGSILSLGSGGNLQTGAFTTQNTPGQYGTFVLIHFVNASNVAVTRTGVITYTLDNGNADVNGLDDGETLTETFTVNANQTSGAQAGDVTATITINIQGATDDLMPTFGTTTITPQTYTTGTAVSVTLPTATGGDAPLAYAITETLPDGLTFTVATRVLDGTPTTAQASMDYTYTATDSDTTNPDSVELTFTITIADPIPPDVPGDGSTTVRLDVPGTLESATSGFNDLDVFLVALVSGGVYQFDGVRLGTGREDPHLTLHRPGQVNLGFCQVGSPGLLAIDDDGGEGTNSRITYTAAQTGDHLLCFRMISGDAGAANYTLTAAVTSEPPSVAADLSIGTLTSSQASVRISDPDFTLTATVTNAGSVAPTGSVFVDFYRDISDRREFGANRATRVQEVEITTLTASGGAVSTFAAAASIPPDRETTPDIIYYFACIRTDDNDLNFCTATISVNLQAASGPFLFFSGRLGSVPSANQVIGTNTSFTGNVSVQNGGDADTAGVVAVDIYQVRQTAAQAAANEIPPLPNDLSTLTVVASGNAQGAGGGTPRIRMNNNGTASISIPVPSTPGVYYYYPCISAPPPPPHPTARETCGDTRIPVDAPAPLTVVAGATPVFAGDQADPFTHTFAPGDPVNLTLPAATGGTAPLRYALLHRNGLDAAALGLVFDSTATPGTLIGTIGNSVALQTSEFTYRVQDADANTGVGDRSDLTLFIAIDNVPSFGASTITPQAYTTGTAVSITLPEATGGDGALTYAITEALPDGLTFTAATRVLDGTPTPTSGQSATDYTYTATDSDTTNPDTVELTFSIAITTPGDATITATNPDPLVENTLNGATLEVTLTGVTYVNPLDPLYFVLVDLNIATNALTLDSVVRDSPTQATLTLAHTGADFDLDGTIRVSVTGAAHTGSGILQAGLVSVTAIVENNDASLSALTLSGGVLLAPAFAADTLVYAADVADNVANITVTPTATDDFATITVNGDAVDSGAASAAITLPAGMTTDINILVTATDGVATQTYTLAVTRVPDITATRIATGTNEVTIIFSAPVNVAASGEANFGSSALNKSHYRFFGIVPTTPTTIEPNADGTAVIITLLRRSGDDIVPDPLASSGSFISLLPGRGVRSGIAAATGPARVTGFSSQIMPPNISFTGDITGGVTEDGATNTARGTVTATNPGNGNTVDIVPITDRAGTYGAFTIVAGGAWTYTLNNADTDTNALTGDAMETETFTIASVAGRSQDIVITITGANDAPTVTISAPLNNAQVVFDAMVTLTATGADVDTGTTLSYAWTATPDVGSFGDAAAASTTWTAPASGTDSVTLTLTATDDATPPLNGTAEVTVNPVAVAVTFAGATTGTVTEGAVAPITGTLTVSSTGSISSTDVVAQTDVSGMYGTFSIEANGVWSYTLDNADDDTNALPAGDEQPDTFTVAAAASASAIVDVTITITGANDAPNADAGPDQPAVAPSATVMLDGSASADPDTGDTITYAWTQDSGTGVSLSNAAVVSPTFTAPDSAGALVFSLVVSDGDLDSAAATVTIEVVAATANIDGNTAVNHLDGLVMYLSLNPVFMSLRGTERFRNELMGHLRTAAVGTTQELVANAEAWRDAVVAGSDVDGVGGVTHLDGLVIYLSLNPVFESLRSTERFRDELMGHLRTTAVTTTQGLVDNANLLTTP